MVLFLSLFALDALTNPAPGQALVDLVIHLAPAAVVAAAVAAVVLLVLRLADVTVQTQTDSQALAPADPAPAVTLAFPALSVPQVPDEFASPTTPSLSFAAPSFPAMSLRIEVEAEFKESI